MPRKGNKTREELAADAKHMREQAKLLPPGPVRDALLREARQAETASQADVMGEFVGTAAAGARLAN